MTKLYLFAGIPVIATASRRKSPKECMYSHDFANRVVPLKNSGGCQNVLINCF